MYTKQCNKQKIKDFQINKRTFTISIPMFDFLDIGLFFLVIYLLLHIDQI